jgi:xylan 1,4-beta-xylosidase
MNQKQKIARIKIGIGVIFGLILIVGLFAGLDLKDKIATLFSEATGTEAELIIDAESDLGPLPRPWHNLAQGGEEAGALTKTVAKIKPLNPDYIRIDHIFDAYEVARKDGGQIQFNWTRLDAEVDAIAAAGAKPLLALSYLPSGFGADITAQPDNWNDWYTLVKTTIEHYSGRTGKNLSDVYYEVWNEPDLFGSWKTSGEKNYLSLYRTSAQAANDAANVQPFKLGGPATTGAYPNWIEALFKLVTEENLRMDFISWHRYSWDADALERDADLINRLLTPYPGLALKEKLLTEWGPDPQNNPAYDNSLGSSHLFVSIRSMLGKIHKAFNFEIMDGKSPEDKPFWGRYGLLTHHASGLQPKPRYDLLLWLESLQGQRLLVTGEGSWVKAIGVKTGNTLTIYMANYDPHSSHREAVPVIISQLKPGSYTVKNETFKGQTTTKTIQITAGTFTDQVNLSPNEIFRLTLAAL